MATVLAPSASSANTSIAQELAAARAEAVALAEELSDIETDLANLETAILAHDEEIEELRAEIAALEEDVREIAVQRYMGAGNGHLTFSDDLHEHQRIDVMMSALQRDSEATLAAYQDASARLETATQELADRIDDQDAARERLAQRLEDLDEELNRLAELQRQAEAEAARIAAERRQAALAAAATTTTTTTTPTTLAETASANPTTTSSNPTTSSPATGNGGSAATAPPPPTAAPTTAAPPPPPPTTAAPPPPPPPPPTTAPPPPSSGFQCPVRGAHTFTDTWGAPRSGGRSHMGVDMLASIGTPAVAPVSGVVTHRYNVTGGHSYHLDGDDGNYYYGTHLSAYGASGRVSAGTVIGYVGDTGNAAGIPHLHFEIHRGGRGNPINPTPTVRAACG